MSDPTVDDNISDPRRVVGYTTISGFIGDDPNEVEDGIGAAVVRVTFDTESPIDRSPDYIMLATEAVELIAALITAGTQVAGDGFIASVLREVMRNELSLPPVE